MSDNFEKHVSRLKSENGEKWSAEFDAEFTYFKVCNLMATARSLANLSRAAVSKESGVPERIIARIEKEDEGVPTQFLDSLNTFYTRFLASRKTEDRSVTTNRLGALVASLSPRESQFAEQF